jgi:Transposase DDE domain group 1
VRLLHGLARTRAVFDDPNLLPNVGLVPLLALAGRAGLPELLAAARPAGPCGANTAAKAMCLVAGMAAGADGIEGMGLLRDGAMEAVFGGVRAPSTLGSFLRSFTWGNVRQLDKAHRGLTAALAADPRLLPGKEELAFIDVDSTQKRVYGYQKEGAAFGHAKVQGKELLLKGLNPLISVISTPLAAPVLGPVRLRGGNTGSARGAGGLAAEAIGAAREAGCTGKIIARFDSAFYNSAVIRTAIRHGAHFSVTVPKNSSVLAAIARIPQDAWTPVAYPQAIWDDQLECWISDAEIAGVPYTAFTSKKKSEQVTARLVVRRVRARNEKEARGRASCSPSAGTTPCSPIPRSKSSRQKGSTATTRSSSRSSPTSTPARLPACRPAPSTRTPPGSSSPRWPSTCCAPPGPAPAPATPRPAPPPSAAASSPCPPAPPATAAATSSFTCPKATTASRPGSTCGQKPPARPPQRPDQPKPGPHSHAARHPDPSPRPADHGSAAQRVSGETPTPVTTCEN